mmetsp:Transcript_55539/g.76994  ORF Transcript_55539/g.76994 Transcript_55539/m.76994 type:complete len:351 (+) Transcript_55539:37-1089(+)
MGCRVSTLSREDKARQKQIEIQLRKDKRMLDQEVKLLLLGAGESGKSTIAKQMKIIHLQGFNEEERRSYKDIIHSNIIGSMRALCIAADKLGNDVSADNQERRQRLAEVSLSLNVLEPDMAEDIKALWADEGITKTYDMRAKFQLNDSSAYYFDEIDRVAAADFIPSEQDVLRSRAKTTGITETEFDVEGVHFRMVDVGGQRSERKKWIHCFQDVTAVIFCVALSEYDMKLYEDETVNRSEESLKLFDEICNSKWFGTTSIILFLNKSDLFREKIQKVDLKVCFPEYDGGCNYENGAKFMKDKFCSLNKNPAQKHVYPHITCATDTDNIKFVFSAVKDIILHQALDTAGF